MDGGLGLDVVDHDAAIVLEFDLRGDLAVDDSLEEGLGHGAAFPAAILSRRTPVTRTRA
jgi:hypothetical protein